MLNPLTEKVGAWAIGPATKRCSEWVVPGWPLSEIVYVTTQVLVSR